MSLYLTIEQGHGLIPGSRASVGLRLPDTTLLDAISPEPRETPYAEPLQLQLRTALACVRFVDSPFSYPPEQIRHHADELPDCAPHQVRRLPILVPAGANPSSC
jgi:hypothetical protein